MRKPRRPRNGPILWPTPWRTAAVFIVLLASITAGAMLAALAGGADRTRGALEDRAGHSLAVSVWGHGLESVDAAAARADEILQGRFGAQRVQLLEPDPRDALLARRAGAANDQQADARLIIIHSPEAGVAKGVNAILKANAVAGAAGEGTRRELVIVAPAAISAAVLAAIALVMTWSVRSELRTNAAAVTLMLQFGVARARIARLAQGKFAVMLVASALVSQGLAAHAIAAWAHQWPGRALGPMPPAPDVADKLSTGAFAVGALIVGMLAAWLGARGALRRWP